MRDKQPSVNAGKWNAAHSTASASLNPANVEHSTLDSSPVINKVDMLTAEAAKVLGQVQSITAQNKKLLTTNAAQAKELEKLNSTCKMKCIEIDTLKALLATNAEWQAEIAQESIAKLENKLQAKEAEVAKVINKLDEVMDWMRKIQDCSNMSKKHELENSVIQLEKQLSQNQALASEFDRLRKSLDLTGNIEDGDYASILRKLEATVKELREKEKRFMHMEAENQSLIIRDRLSNYQLQEARKTLITKFRGSQSTIGIKQMGLLNPLPFVNECRMNLDWNDRCLKGTKVWFLWVEHVKNSHWRPFKIDHDNNRIIIDEDDETLKDLRNEWGDRIYKAVTNALLEMEVYNPRGRCIVPELWNFEENRKASLQEAIEHLERRTEEVGTSKSQATGK